MKIMKLIFFVFILLFSIMVTSVTAEYKGLQSFEDYPTGIFPGEGSYLFSIDYWFPEIADEPIVEIVEDKDHVYHGNKSVRLDIDGRHDDGSVWLLASIPASLLGSPGTTHTLEINGWLWSSVQSNFNVWPIIAAISKNKPISNETKQEEDFEKIGYTEEDAGWTNYALKKQKVTLPDNKDSLIYFAFGISVTWETQRTYWIDFLSIKVDDKLFSGSQTPESSPSFSFVTISLIFVGWVKYRKMKQR